MYAIKLAMVTIGVLAVATIAAGVFALHVVDATCNGIAKMGSTSEKIA